MNLSAISEQPATGRGQQVRSVLLVWGVFIALAVLINGTIPFILGVDMHTWTYSPVKTVVFSLLVYAGLFLVVPLLLVKGWKVVQRPVFLGPLLLAVIAILAWPFARPAAALVVLVLAYLHWRFDLSDLGFRSRNWKGDVVAILLMGLLSFLPALLKTVPLSFTPGAALIASLNRLFANPASTVENLFYFGFLAERLFNKTGRWFTPPLIGLMYTVHEMSNPEYWYEGMAFGFTFLVVAITTAFYLWRHSVVVVWLGDGLARFVTRLL